MILLDTSVLIEAFAFDGEVRERVRGAIEGGHRTLNPKDFRDVPGMEMWAG